VNAINCKLYFRSNSSLSVGKTLFSNSETVQRLLGTNHLIQFMLLSQFLEKSRHTVRCIKNSKDSSRIERE